MSLYRSLLLVAACGGAVFAQDVISAKSGLIHYMEGVVKVDGAEVVKKSTADFPAMKEGSELQTAMGRAEVLLSPGVFLRISENSSVRLDRNDLLDTQLTLTGGTVLIEVSEAEKNQSLTVAVGKTKLDLARHGLYRVDAEETLKTTRALGISYVAYSPLGRSLLTGAVRQAADIPEGDGRGRHPRFAADNLARNLAKVAVIEAVAQAKGCKPGQVALAWLMAQGDDIVPIPGTKRAARVDENLAALDVVLSADEVARLSAALPPGAAAGTRYPEAAMKAVYL